MSDSRQPSSRAATTKKVGTPLRLRLIKCDKEPTIILYGKASTKRRRKAIAKQKLRLVAFNPLTPAKCVFY